jgi:preprotein translocase subunit SecA
MLQTSCARYVYLFFPDIFISMVHSDQASNYQPPHPHRWDETKTRLHQAWRDSKTKAKTSYDEDIRKYGLKDKINAEFVEKCHQRNKPGQKEAFDKIEKNIFHRLSSPFLNLH